jgi:hypothetical protein
MNTSNYDAFMKLDLSPYLGKWIAVCNKKIVSSGDNVKEVFDEAKKQYPHEKPFIAKIPSGDTMIF